MAKRKKEKIDTIVNAGLAGVAGDTVARFGSGIKEHIVGYSGVDNEAGTTLKRGLKSIADYKRCAPSDPDYDRTTKAQAGFSAEAKEVARRRAEEAISGKKPTTVRTDDIPGHVNDQLFDITSAVDSNGDPIPGASAQMKFIGSSPSAAVEKMMSKGYQKYIDNDVKMIVPSDYFDGMKNELDERIQSLQKQVEYLKSHGSQEALAAKEAELQKCKTLDRNLQKSNTSNEEAIEARNSPAWSTAKDVVRVAHRAGVEQAKMGAAIGGGISLVRNLVDVCKGKKSKSEAALSIVGDTSSAATLSYVTAFGGAVIKGTAQNSTSKVLQNISKTNLPAYIATSTLEISKTLYSFFKGNSDGIQCLDQLGEKGYGMVNSALYAAIGQALIPIPVVGALAGSMLGYALSSASYYVLFNSLKDAKIARAERIRIECECAEAVAMMQEYRGELENSINKYLHDKYVLFERSFDMIKEALAIGDIDGYISANNHITEGMEKKVLYRNMAEFDELMNSDITIKL